MTTGESAFLAQVAPKLTRRSDRFFAIPGMEQFSYPLSAQARFSEIEDSSFWFRHRNQIIGTLVRRFTPLGPIIDIGGGNGYVSYGLSQLGYSSIVLEPGAEGADIAHDRGLTVIRAGFDSETFLPQSLSAIGLFDVIEHIENAHKFLVDCQQALNHGGMLYVTVPAYRVLWSSDDAFAGHFRRYSRTSLKRALEEAGFDVVFITAFFSLLVIPLFFLRSLPSALGFRKVSTADQAVAHHQVGRLTSAILERSLRWEISAINTGHTIPFGTSLIAAARRR